MEAAIENIASFTVVGNLAVNQLMEREATTVVTTKVAFAEKPKWTTMVAKNVHQVVNQAMETLTDAPKQEECKLNLRLIGFKAKEGETKKELVQQLNTELLQGQMRLCAKVIAATWQWLRLRGPPPRRQARTPSQCCSKFAMSKDR